MDGVGEDALLAGLLANLDDEARWLIYADWLLDNDREEEAATLRCYQTQMRAGLAAGFDFALVLKVVTRETTTAPQLEAIRERPTDDERWHAYADRLRTLGHTTEAQLLREYLDDVRALWMDGHDLWDTLRTLARCGTEGQRRAYLLPTPVLEALLRPSYPTAANERRAALMAARQRFWRTIRVLVLVTLGLIVIPMLAMILNGAIMRR